MDSFFFFIRRLTKHFCGAQILSWLGCEPKPRQMLFYHLDTNNVEVHDSIIVVVISCFENIFIQRQNFGHDRLHDFGSAVQTKSKPTEYVIISLKLNDLILAAFINHTYLHIGITQVQQSTVRRFLSPRAQFFFANVDICPIAFHKLVQFSKIKHWANFFFSCTTAINGISVTRSVSFN